MTAERLNYVTILHIHKKLTDTLDVKHVLNEFISADNLDIEHRRVQTVKQINDMLT